MVGASHTQSEKEIPQGSREALKERKERDMCKSDRLKVRVFSLQNVIANPWEQAVSQDAQWMREIALAETENNVRAWGPH